MIKYIWFFLAIPLFAGEFSINAELSSPREVLFKVSYIGDPVDIVLPRRAKVVQPVNPNIIQDTYDRQQSILRGDSATNDQPITFSYTVFLTDEPEYGNLLEDWYPITRGATESTYKLAVSGSGAFIFPYQDWADNVYTFSLAEKPKMSVSRFVRLPEQGTLPVTLYSSLGIEATPDEIRRIYQHNVSIYGSQGINEIVVVNSSRITEEAFLAAGKLFISMPARGTINQFTRLIPDAWNKTVPSLSPRIFRMIKDAVLRFKPLSTPPNNTGPFVTDPLWIEPVGSKAYYTTLFGKGLDNNGSGIELVDVNAAALIDNKAMLSLVEKHVGVESFFTGIKQMFEKRLPATSGLADYEQLDWDSLLQNKLSEPLISFFKKDAFRPGFNAILSIENNLAVRNSDYIPNFRIQHDTGIVSVEWKGKYSTPLNTDALWVQLDSDRLIPRLDFLSSYRTLDTNEQLIRAKVMMAAQRLKTPSVDGFRTHYECLMFSAPANPYEVEEGTPVYVVVSLVSALGSGTLKPAIQEAFFIIDEFERPALITTRLRL